MRSLVALLIGVLAIAAFLVGASSSQASTIGLNSSRYTGTAIGTLTFDPGGILPLCDYTFAIAVSTPFTATSLPAVGLNRGRLAISQGVCGMALTMLSQPLAVDIVVDGGPGAVTGTTTFVAKGGSFELAFSGGALRCLYAGDLPITVNSAGTTGTIFWRLPLASGFTFCPNPLWVVGTIALRPTMVVTLS